MSDENRCQFCGQAGDWCACGEPFRPLPRVEYRDLTRDASTAKRYSYVDGVWSELPIAAEPAPPKAYPDCLFPNACECRSRGYPRPERIGCVVPCINAEADRLGWRRPYPAEGSDEIKLQNTLAELDIALRDGLHASLVNDWTAAEAAMRRSNELLAILRKFESAIYAKSL